MIELDRLFLLSSRTKLLLAMVWDFFAIAFALAASFWIRLGISSEQITYAEQYLIIITLFFTLLTLFMLGHYRHIIRYLSGKAVVLLLYGITASCVFMFILQFPLHAFLPNSVPFIYW
ncbi:MAG: hypothetical protein JKX78_07390, partial [Alteromonadaceae bacterium]|nr:hypothetical protein [Alteromonadaceae bacterium]